MLLFVRRFLSIYWFRRRFSPKSCSKTCRKSWEISWYSRVAPIYCSCVLLMWMMALRPSIDWLVDWLIDAKRCVNKTSELTYAHSDCCCHLFAVVYNSTRHYRLRRFALWQCLWFVCSSVSCKIGEVIHYVAGPGSEWGLIVLAPVHLLKLKTLTFVIGVKTFLLASRYNALVQTNNTPVVNTKEFLRNLIDL